ncbi:MAG TPA: tyrosine-type recombinase/integrase [Patescibacteria group bacterium]|nr:tyrosine-type recombinase/integrase [Patescibacteria group bacterium]
MSLVKRGNKWWSFIWIDGVRHAQSTGTANRRQAEAVERQIRDQLNEARHRLPQLQPEMTFGKLVARFIAEGIAKPHALDRLKHLLPFFGGMPLIDINGSAVRRYRQERHREKTLTVATVNRDLSVLRRVLYWGVEEGYLSANPLGRLRMERERRTKRPVMSLREERLLLAASPDHLKRIILCALHTGMRRGEILAQRWEDIDFDHRILYVTHSKTPEGEAREIPLTASLFESLQVHRRPQGPIFTYLGDPIKIVKTTWASSLRRAGIRHFRFHDLRHTANTRMMLAGVLQEVRREIIGHTSRRSRDVNDRYTQIELPEKREAIAKLEAWLERQARELAAAEAQALLPPPPTHACEEHRDDNTQSSTHTA